MQRNRAIPGLVGLVLIVLVGGYWHWSQGRMAADGSRYDPVINPGDFVPQVTNKYFTLKTGTKFAYKNSSGTERIEVLVTGEKKIVMGVTATVVRAREWLNDKLKEDTRDYYAQDKHGNVWYFGEAVDNYQDGKIRDHAGSWEAGIDGAKPGIIMLKDPKVGDTYRQEYYKGKAEDMGTVVALGRKIAVAAGTFEGCLQIRDWSRIDATNEHKYFCPAVGFVVLEEPVLGFGRVELVSVSVD